MNAGPSPVVYLADEAMEFVSVRFPSSLRQLAVEELAKPRGFLIVSNALLRQASAPIPSLSAGEFTVLKTSSVEHQIQEQLKQLKSSIQVTDRAVTMLVLENMQLCRLFGLIILYTAFYSSLSWRVLHLCVLQAFMSSWYNMRVCMYTCFWLLSTFVKLRQTVLPVVLDCINKHFMFNILQSQEHFFKGAEEKLLSLVHTPSQPGSRTPKVRQMLQATSEPSFCKSMT